MSMNLKTASRLLLWTILWMPGSAPGQPAMLAEPPAQVPARYDTDLLPATFHQSRRQAVLEMLPDSSLAVLFSAPIRNRNSDVEFPYRQSSDLYYVTGMTEPESVLLLAPSGFDFQGEWIRELLLVPPTDPRHEIWEGRRLGPERAGRELGIEHALPNTRFDSVLTAALGGTRGPVHTLAPPGDVDPESPLGRQLDLLRAHIDGTLHGVRVADTKRLRDLLTGLRAVKTKEEITLLERAITITGDALVEVMKSIEPGMFEYEAQAVIEYVFKRSGAASPGYPSIVGSGENSVILHYTSNRKRMNAGEVVVMDVGAEMHGYTADITRTVPVSGRFSQEQRALYDLVLRAQQAAIEASRAGAPFSAPHRAASRELARGLADLGLIAGPADGRGLGRFFMHGTSHYLGLDVHDVGSYQSLQPGNVITIEPGLYISPAPDIDPRWWNIGIRIEDDILITDGEPLVLSARTPSDPDEVEALMALRGIGNDPEDTR